MRHDEGTEPRMRQALARYQAISAYLAMAPGRGTRLKLLQKLAVFGIVARRILTLHFLKHGALAPDEAVIAFQHERLDLPAFAAHAGSTSDLHALVDYAVKQFGGVDIIVNNAATNPVFGPIVNADEGVFDKIMSVNVKGPLELAKRAFPIMAERGGGKIINLSSIRGARGATGGNLAYCASKGAVNMLTKQLACELAPKNVLVNAIAPIITITPMTAERIKNEASRYERMLLNVPMGRMGTVADLIGPVVFLASPASDFVTGTILYPDGGMSSFV